MQKIKTISFNQYEKDLLERAESKENFTAWVKLQLRNEIIKEEIKKAQECSK